MSARTHSTPTEDSSETRRDNVTSRPLVHPHPRTVALLLALAVFSLPPAAVADPTGPQSETATATHERCHSALSFVEVPVEGVRPLVPDEYTVKSDNGATTYLNVDPFACEDVTLGNKTGPVRFAVVSAEICPRGGTEADCLFGVEQYLLFLVTDSEAYAEWLRAGTGLEVKHVPGIVHDFDRPDVGLAPYLFEAPKPSPSPFEVEGTIAAQTTIAVEIEEAQWFFQDSRTADGKRWTVTIGYDLHHDFFAPGDITITAEDGSEMAQIMGRSEAKPALTVPHWIENFEMRRTVTVTAASG